MQQGFYVRRFGPSFVYLKFRCSRCKKLGEQYIKQEDWDASMLKDGSKEFSEKELVRFSSLGQITIDEMINFHYELESLEGMPKVVNHEVEKEQ